MRYKIFLQLRVDRSYSKVETNVLYFHVDVSIYLTHLPEIVLNLMKIITRQFSYENDVYVDLVIVLKLVLSCRQLRKLCFRNSSKDFRPENKQEDDKHIFTCSDFPKPIWIKKMQKFFAKIISAE